MSTKENKTTATATQEQSATTFNNEKRIVLWKNDQSTADNYQPIVRGQVTIDGKLYYISLWAQKDKNGNTFWNGKVRKSDEMFNQSNEALPF